MMHLQEAPSNQVTTNNLSGDCECVDIRDAHVLRRHRASRKHTGTGEAVGATTVPLGAQERHPNTESRIMGRSTPLVIIVPPSGKAAPASLMDWTGIQGLPCGIQPLVWLIWKSSGKPAFSPRFFCRTPRLRRFGRIGIPLPKSNLGMGVLWQWAARDFT